MYLGHNVSFGRNNRVKRSINGLWSPFTPDLGRVSGELGCTLCPSPKVCPGKRVSRKKCSLSRTEQKRCRQTKKAKVTEQVSEPSVTSVRGQLTHRGSSAPDPPCAGILSVL